VAIVVAAKVGRYSRATSRKSERPSLTPVIHDGLECRSLLILA
jgi:hypothetical protein